MSVWKQGRVDSKMMFKLFGYKIRLEIWKNTDDKIVMLTDSRNDFHTDNFWEKIR